MERSDGRGARRGAGIGAALVAAAMVSPAAAQETEAPPAGEGLREEVKRFEDGEASRDEEEILVTGRKRRTVDVTVPLNAGASRDSLDNEWIREIPPWSVEEIANRLPGISSRLYSGDEYIRPSLAARGMFDNGFTEYIAVHVDGINTSRLIYGWTALSQFPITPERIHAAETFRGGQAVRFGPTALGGVVNFVTEPIPEAWVLGQKVTLGEHGFHSSKTTIGGTDADSGLGFLLTHVDRGGNTWRRQSDFRVNDTALKLTMPLDEHSTLSVNGMYWRDVHALMGRLTEKQLEEDPRQNPNHPEVRWSGWSHGVDATYRREASEDTWLEIQAYERYGHQNLPSMRPAAPPFTGFRNQVIDTDNRGLQVKGEVPFDLGLRHRIHAGARYHFEDITRDIWDTTLIGGNVTRVSDVRVQTDVLSLHVDDTVEWAGFTANLGARYENILDSDGRDAVSLNDRSFDFDKVFYGGSLTYAFDARFAAFTNYHQSFRAPQTWSYNFTNRDQPLTFETGDTRELGFRAQGLRGFSGNVVGWKNRLSDFIDFDPLTLVYANLGRFKSEGVDLTLQFDGADASPALKGFAACTTHTWQEARFHSGTFEGNRVQHVPTRIWKGAVRYEHEGTGLYGSLDFNYRARTEATPENDAESMSYTLWNGRLGWRKVRPLANGREIRFDVGVAVMNLFDRKYHLRHDRTQYVPGNPRTAFVEFSISIDI